MLSKHRHSLIWRNLICHHHHQQQQQQQQLLYQFWIKCKNKNIVPSHRNLSSLNKNQSSSKTECTVCGSTIDCCQQICNKCNKITNANDEKCKDCSHFEVLGLDATYTVDKKLLEKRFKDLQMLLHPDKYETGSSREKLNSSLHSSSMLLLF